jgi:hypothetical protein
MSSTTTTPRKRLRIPKDYHLLIAMVMWLGPIFTGLMIAVYSDMVEPVHPGMIGFAGVVVGVLTMLTGATIAVVDLIRNG